MGEKIGKDSLNEKHLNLVSFASFVSRELSIPSNKAYMSLIPRLIQKPYTNNRAPHMLEIQNTSVRHESRKSFILFQIFNIIVISSYDVAAIILRRKSCRVCMSTTSPSRASRCYVRV
jgi:hypothetical protein